MGKLFAHRIIVGLEGLLIRGLFDQCDYRVKAGIDCDILKGLHSRCGRGSVPCTTRKQCGRQYQILKYMFLHAHEIVAQSENILMNMKADTYYFNNVIMHYVSGEERERTYVYFNRTDAISSGWTQGTDRP